MVFHYVVCQDGGELFLGERILGTYAGELGNEDLGILRNLYSGIGCNPESCFAYYIRIQGALFRVDDIIGNQLSLLLVEEVAAVLFHE